MKKVKYLLIAVLALVLVTGCGGKTKTLKCTVETEAGSIKYTATYEVEYTEDDKIVKSVNTTEVLTADDESYLETAKRSAEDLYQTYGDKYGGYSYDVTVKGDTLTSKCTIDYTKMDVKQYVEDNDLTNFADKDNNVKLEGVKEIYKQLGATCESE